MRGQMLVAIAAVGVLSAAVPGWAHHAFSAEFDAADPVRLIGTVAKMELVNPHAWIYVDVKNSDGKVVTWAIECGAPNSLIRRGFNKNSLPVGSELVVEGYRAKDGLPKANGRSVTFADGRIVFVGSSDTGAPADGRDPSEAK